MGLPGDIAAIDAYLDDARFFEPFRPFFEPEIGRPSSARMWPWWSTDSSSSFKSASRP
jgi:hypothetical protein